MWSLNSSAIRATVALLRSLTSCAILRYPWRQWPLGDYDPVASSLVVFRGPLLVGTSYCILGTPHKLFWSCSICMYLIGQHHTLAIDRKSFLPSFSWRIPKLTKNIIMFIVFFFYILLPNSSVCHLCTQIQITIWITTLFGCRAYVKTLMMERKKCTF